MTVTVRPGHAGDLPAVHDLVRELARFERAEDQLTATVDDYRRDFAAGDFALLIAEVDGVTGGIMLYYRAYSTWRGRMLYLEDFVVAERFRRRGIGEALWGALVAEARARDCRLVKWQVLDWNAAAKAFYRKVGARLDGEWENGVLPV